ncbi:Transmembrane protein 47 [Aphelenchoides bicaudatus]|nr:Transmembrane protein 47 [Aphelenchoides bicaudatus]
MPAQTTTIQTVTAVRPLKIISVVCLLLSIVLLIICLSTTYWLKTQYFHTGLFTECVNDDVGAKNNPMPNAPEPGKCQPAKRSPAYVTAVAILLIVATVTTFCALVSNLLGLRSNDLHRKYILYKAATYLSLFSVLCELVSLIVFPVCFFFTMHFYGLRNWEFDISYAVAWGAMLFSFGASLLLICDKEHDEIYYKEKTIWNPPVEYT